MLSMTVALFLSYTDPLQHCACQWCV